MEMNPIFLSQASVTHEGTIKSLLKRNNLPSEDIIPKNLKDFFIAKTKEKIIGVIGLEIFEEIGLLRSLCVEETYRKKGIGFLLYKDLLIYAHSKGIKELYLLTMTAEGFFQQFGFVAVDRSIVPEPIRMTSEFKDLCPSSAVCMKMKFIN
ncbi:acetyltransferase (GNAT) domain protein [Leptospira wolbachii serovar Codice str. CDC]|uniref:Acetyltransferase (GNAT) domain protein n=1 Tax=Leptospira wolbachii serovar Codice str. CDC TaxID=1218599 RepID=R8ZZR5_9LEPT|nr:arsenic resistance N-acetyltransferase ArsN2 [Leptospira wolbachii]EOQ95337.1 acetyltransferase (GNAT) domain protein [Leptospira wolbachii serovar Codice str. CDC]